jgi:hypothetical protein
MKVEIIEWDFMQIYTAEVDELDILAYIAKKKNRLFNTVNIDESVDFKDNEFCKECSVEYIIKELIECR